MPLRRTGSRVVRARPEPVEEPDRLIAAIAASSDRDAFTRLFGHYAPRIKGYLLRMGCEAGLAEELAQEVMLTIWRKAHLFDASQASANAWIYAIARNARVDAFRRERVRASAVESPDVTVRDDSDARLWLASVEMRLPDALAELPADQAQAVKSAFLEGLSHNEIATKYELPIGTVKSRVRRALLALRRALERRR